MTSTVLELGKKARAAALEMAVCGSVQRNAALNSMADALLTHMEDILSANAQDILAAKEKGLVRSEGKEYVMKDGDIVLFRFNV